MFVENFPHLGCFEEKALTFDRAVALLREDIEFISLEHPLYQSTLDYFWGLESGIAGVSFSRDIPTRSFALEVFFNKKESVFIDENALEIKPSAKLSVVKERKMDPQDTQKMFALYGKRIKELCALAMKIASKKHKDAKLDSIHIYIGLA
ncbi:MAG: hypothetical protein R3A80_01010 [Bdellovibrionota bacterium]